VSALREVTSLEEIPVFFPAGEQTLFGIFTRPTVEPLGVAAIVLPGGGGTRLTTNRNRFSVTLCRRLAALGYHTLRCDFRGAGESTGTADALRLDHPFVDDVDGAVRWVQQQGVSNFVVVGSCFGARTALSYAPQCSGIRGVVLISAPVRDYREGEKQVTRMAQEWSIWRYAGRALRIRTLKGLLDQKHRKTYAKVARAKLRAVVAKNQGSSQSRSGDGVSPNFLEPLAFLADRSLPVMLIHGDGEPAHREFLDVQTGSVGDLLKRPSARIEVRTAPAPVHGFTAVASQKKVIDLIVDWFSRQRSVLSGEETENKEKR
jgi:pimeloyl-ACP methyl ester carboxylesterase